MSGPLPRLLVLWAVLAAAPEVGRSQEPAGTGEIAGRVVRPDGLPQADADVVLAQRMPSGALRQLTRWRARTGFDGRYAITGVPPGRYLVLVRAIGSDVGVAGRPGATLFPHMPVDEVGTLVEVLPGLPTEGIDVWMVPSPRRFTITGRVFGPEGTSFDSLILETGRPGARATDVWTSAEPGGLFTIDPAPAGTLVLKARATIGDRVLTGLATTTVAANPVEDVRITVRPMVEVTGRIRSTPPALLPAGLTISLVPQALEPTALYPAPEAAVDGDGRFRLTADAAPVRIVVRGLPAGWRVTRAGGLSLDAAAPAASLQLFVAPPR
jgi:hypothetical protein